MVLIATGGPSGGLGGNITFNVGTSTTLNVDSTAIQISNPSNANSGGGSISLTAGNIQNAVVGGPLTMNVDGQGTGTGGALSLNLTNASAAVSIGASAAANFDFSAKNGGSINFSTNNDLSFETDVNNNPTGINVASTTAPGSLAFTAANINITGPILIFNVGGASQGGGSISLTATAGPLNIGTVTGVGDIECIAINGPTSAKAGSVSLSAPAGVLTVDMAAVQIMSVTKTNPNVGGGSISLEGHDIQWPTRATAPLVVKATGAGKGAGGNVSITLDDPTATLTVGTLPGQFTVGIGGTVQTGVLNLSSQGNLIINTKGITDKPVSATGGTKGAVISLAAGDQTLSDSGNLQITGGLSIAGSSTTLGGKLTPR